MLLTGVVFEDRNLNDQRDFGEPGIGGMPIGGIWDDCVPRECPDNPAAAPYDTMIVPGSLNGVDTYTDPNGWFQLEVDPRSIPSGYTCYFHVDVITMQPDQFVVNGNRSSVFLWQGPNGLTANLCIEPGANFDLEPVGIRPQGLG